MEDLAPMDAILKGDREFDEAHFGERGKVREWDNYGEKVLASIEIRIHIL